jgi:hypothetical protein
MANTFLVHELDLGVSGLEYRTTVETEPLLKEVADE